MSPVCHCCRGTRRYDGVRFGVREEGAELRAMYGATRERGFGAEVKRRILMGTYALSAGYYDAFYKKAQQARTPPLAPYACTLNVQHALPNPWNCMLVALSSHGVGVAAGAHARQGRL